MRLAALALSGLIIMCGAAGAIDYPNQPNSGAPVWLDNGLIRFNSNLEARQTGDYSPKTYVVRPDGTGLTPATPEQAAAPAAAVPSSPRLVIDSPYGGKSTPLFLVDASGQRRTVTTTVYTAPASALSPDGRIVVFASWVGWSYNDGAALYSVPVDGSSQPRRLTPTPCTLDTATHSALTGRCFDGTDGADHLIGTVGGDLVIAGSGADTIRAGGGQNIVQAQWGNDDIRTGSGRDFLWGGGGNDLIRSGSGGDTIHPGPGRDTVDAGSGADHVVANDGQRDIIDCGSGFDGARVDQYDVVRNCENVNRTRAENEDGTPS
jgi:Ca2+-binding RTX toxin-like protein